MRRSIGIGLAAGLLLLTPFHWAGAQGSFTTEVQLAVDTSAGADVQNLRRADEQRIADALKRRLTIFTNTGEGSVKFEGFSNIRLRLPVERVNPVQLKSLTRAARLEVRHLDDLQTGTNPGGRYQMSVINVQGGGKEQSSTRFFDQKSNKVISAKEFVERSPLVLSNADVAPNGAAVVSGNGLTVVRVQFAEAGTRKLEGLLRKQGRMLAVVLDGEIISMSATPGQEKRRPEKRKKGEEAEREIPQLDILGGFGSAEEAGYLAAVFNAGPLPVPLKVVGTRLIAE